MIGEDEGQPRSARRKAGRLRLRLPAQIITPKGTERVVLCDLSEDGARVFARTDLPRGRDVVLRWGQSEAFGSVVWERAGFHGLQFEEPLARAVLVAARAMQDTAGLTRNDLSHWMADKGWSFGKAL